MKLRDRLVLFSTIQLVVFGAIFGAAYLAFQREVIPMFEDLLHAKSERVARLIAAELDVSLGADDRNLMTKQLAAIETDADFRTAVVRDANDHVVLVRGVPADPALFQDAPYLARQLDDGIAAWAPVTLEGMKLGSVSVEFDTERLDTLSAWARRIVWCVFGLWLAALVYSLVFARETVRPIRAMMEFSRKVAGGMFSARLDAPAPGELAELRDFLNHMTAELEAREAERQKAAAKAEEMQRELLAVSRTAGMAEVATGVLHNVGNVLNSLNISVAVIGDQVRNSRVGSLSKSIELFDKFPGGLPAFLSTDKGKLLPDYLSTVSKRLVEENAKMLGELASVTRNVDHIKTIVAMQQSYARPSGLKEPVQLANLIDDALRMGESSFAKHKIEIVRDYEDLPPIEAERHKLLQILINLISNARHALKADGATPPHRLTVRMRRDERRVVIEIADNGVGIPKDNFDKIFRHGFTTKAGGHGFGLHASANAARELGGSLTAASDGIGRGATFTLELPIDEHN